MTEGVPTRIELDGTARNVVQAGHITGGVSVTSSSGGRLPVPQQLPPDIAQFTGRKDDLDRLDALLLERGPARTGAVVVTALGGTAGVGKTALAVHWAHRVKHHFPDGVLYADLHGYDPHRPAEPAKVLDHFLHALDIRPVRFPEDPDGKATLYRSLMAERRTLVVLDNASDPAQVRPLIPGSPTCFVVVTSRSRLNGLEARDGARPIALGLMPVEDAIALLGEVVGHDRVDAEPRAARELVRLCDRLPPALRIAAQRVSADPTMRLAELVGDLSVERDRLDGLDAGDDETTAVRPVFSWSYHALPPAPQRVFRLLGVHDSPTITVETAAVLVDTTARLVRNELESLVAVHLLARTGPHYRFHDLVRVYARERAALDEPDRFDAVWRLGAWRRYEWHRRAAAINLKDAAEAILPYRYPDIAVECGQRVLTAFAISATPGRRGG